MKTNEKRNNQEMIIKKKINLSKKSIEIQRQDIKFESLRLFIFTADMVFRYLDIELQKSGLTRTRLGILLALVINGGSATPTQISRQVVRTKFSITGAVDNLEKDGLVKRLEFTSDKKSDRRLRKVAITQKGLDALSNSMPLTGQLASSIMCCFSTKDIRKFYSILSFLLEKMIELSKQS